MRRPAARCIALWTLFAPTLVAAQSLPTAAPAAPGEVIVKFRPASTTLASAAALSSRKGLPTTMRLAGRTLDLTRVVALRPASKAALSAQAVGAGWDRVYTLTVAGAVDVAALARELAADPAVESAQPNYRYQIDGLASSPVDDLVPPASRDSLAGQQWNLVKVGAPTAWQTTRGASPAGVPVRVGIIDTGIDYTHPDLAPNLWINPAEDANHNGTFEPWSADSLRKGVRGDFDGIDSDGNGYVDDVIGYDFTDQTRSDDGSDFRDRDPDPMDENLGVRGHGTGVAGIIGAVADNGIGVAGIAPAVRLVALRAFNGAGASEDDDIASALLYAADNGIRVVNMSFGDAVISPIMRDAIRYAHLRGVVMTTSSGNVGGDNRHYPSGYDETISVGMTTQEDAVVSISTYGTTVDLTAPGVSIPTTAIRTRYEKSRYRTDFGGTSAAAPHVAAAAALILSRKPDLSADEVRAIITSSADDIGNRGWDHFSGAGRLNVARAVAASFAPLVGFDQPTGDGGSSGAPISFIGSASSPYLSDYEIFYKVGSTYKDYFQSEADWHSITGRIRRQVVHDTLAVWNWTDAAGQPLPDTTYTLRLAVHQGDSTTVEDRIDWTLDRTPPRFLPVRRDSTGARGVSIIPAWDGDQDAVLVQTRTDDLSEAWLELPTAGGVRRVAMGGIVNLHSALVGPDDLPASQTVQAVVVARNVAGLTSRSAPIPLRRTGARFPTAALAKLPLEIPSGYLLDKAGDFLHRGTDQLIATIYDREKDAYRLGFFDIPNDGPLTERDSITFDTNLLPKDLGDPDGDGSLDLMTYINAAQKGGVTVVFRTRVQGGVVNIEPAFADTSGRVWGAAFADVDGDGRPNEMVARLDSTFNTTDGYGADDGYAVYQVGADSKYRRMAKLPNPTRSGPDDRYNGFGPPRAVVADYDGDGRPEVVMADTDGDFYLDETVGSSLSAGFRHTWTDSTDLVNRETLLASGDFDGDGRMEFVTGVSSDYVQTQNHDYDAPYWIVRLWKAAGNDSYRIAWQQAFYGFADTDNSLSAGDLTNDGIADLIICAAPNLYVFTTDGHGGLKPFWTVGGAGASATLVHDFDGDGRNELFFNTGRAIVRYEGDAAGSVASRLQPPLDFHAVAVPTADGSPVELRWVAPTEAPTGAEIVVLRGTDPRALSPLVTLPITATGFTDTQTSRDVRYTYGIIVRSGDESGRSARYEAVTARSPITLVSARQEGPAQVRLVFSRPVGDRPLDPTLFAVGSLAATTATSVRGGAEWLLSFSGLSGALPTGGDLSVARAFESSEGVQVEPQSVTLTRMTAPSTERFYLTTLTRPSPTTLRLTFSRPVNRTVAVRPATYRITPTVGVTAASVDSGGNSVTLSLDPSRPIGPLGVRFTVEVDRSLTSADGVGFDEQEAGRTLSLVEAARNLADVMVYPNPFRAARNNVSIGVTFAHLTPRATVTVFTLGGEKVRVLTEATQGTDAGDGGLRWDLKNEQGQDVRSGVYLYRVTGGTLNSSGDTQDVEAHVGKLVVVR